jgi:hypothetical protein
MATIAYAPIQDDFLSSEANIPRDAWLQWFADLGTSLNGQWNIDSRLFSSSGIDTVPDDSYVSSTGREVSFLFVWDNGVTFTNGTFTLGRQDLTVLPGMLQVWENSTLVSGAYCKDNIISFTSAAYSGRVIVQGTILTKISKRGGS